jgi:A/G-specific adenine glycosylase
MERLREWFVEQQRDLPWRQEKTAYRVWISEVMLQQTQVAVVVPYFYRWMEKFPTIEALAKASIDEVIKAWEGLGYYSRARNLHTASKQILEQYRGEIPSQPAELEKLAGFGPYTIGAVRSFAFQQRAAAVDGNVVRVLSRFFATDQEASNRKYYAALTLSVLPQEEPWVVMEALIELGALVCLRKPNCLSCPLKSECRAYSQGTTDLFPVKKTRPETIYLKRQVAVIRFEDEVLLCQGALGKVMAGLYEFPYADLNDPLPFDLPLEKIVDLPPVKQSFTRYQATLYPSLYKIRLRKTLNGFEWKKWDELPLLPFSSGHRKILKLL